MKCEAPDLTRKRAAVGPPSLDARRTAELCLGCARCCTYVTIEIDPPRRPWEYDQWIWLLHHEGLALYVERPEQWFVYVPTRCRQLTDQGRCQIHGRHPVLCRDYDPRSCERREPHGGLRAWFDRAEELETWIQRHRPVHWKRLLAYRREQPPGEPVADAEHRRRAGPSLIMPAEPARAAGLPADSTER